MSNITDRMNLRNIEQGRPVITPQERARLRKQFARKQKVENILAGSIAGVAIVLGALFVLVLALLPVAFIIGAVVAVAFGVVDIATHGFNFWAIFWIILGAVLLSRTRFTTTRS